MNLCPSASTGSKVLLTPPRLPRLTFFSFIIQILTVAATDGDALVAGGTVSYSIVNGDSDTIFGIDPSGGAVFINDNTNLNYEATTVYTLTIR